MHITNNNKQLSLKQNMAWNSVGSLTYMICQWLTTVLVVRLSFGNYEIAGVYSLAMSVYAIFIPIAHYRMYVYQVTDIKKENTIGEYFAFRLISCGIALLLCLIYSLLTSALNTIIPILCYGVFKNISYLIDVLHAEDQKMKRMDIIGQSLVMQGVFSLVAFCLVFYFSQNLVFAICAMSVSSGLVGWLFDLPKTKAFGAIAIRISFAKVIYLFKHCLLPVAGYMATACSPSIPRQYLFYKFGEAALGGYGSISAPVAVIQMGASYIYNPLMGYFAEAFSVKDVQKFRSLFAKATLCIVGIGVACSLLLIIVCKPLFLFLFGSTIESYIEILPLLTLSSLIFVF